MKNVFSTLTLATCLFLASCGSSSKDNCSSVGLSQTFQDELNQVTESATAFSNDPTNSVKCEAFKDAYNNYIDALEGWEDCAIALSQETEWRASLDEARTAINEIEC